MMAFCRIVYPEITQKNYVSHYFPSKLIKELYHGAYYDYTTGD
jgi:hypothetical protein